ncbi:hypothetical protein LOZ12_001430 [Ophidiomyces ophidiicola]|uniref:Uncharacterized protein n=1 Tax=Ophidiomyces ophidiicola TaxID=1387563 RepID=A0ACB8UUR9_9EURO|nr:hypothetical protein LOZ64_004195 [Ophidiomyces ophidiicola]KAI1944550.1 hypothetical protein LOZ62_004137 [Ophidiomyces ophidiicola]KAI2004728.1 hypothetical protein LOZ50_004108 [Ophidiomyces ophidiicola]KAI2028763.1 hypothetical protein LOZ45_002048 [Ophidiomyces ophidiicola]KAI2038292.1 hypothetical protein LOZ47_003350 [Ophidiomyces ophidiicola]
MGGLLDKLKSNHAVDTAATQAKKDAFPPALTPLQRMLLDAGPLRNDGSDKFFGMENVRLSSYSPEASGANGTQVQYGNTCYCNSILQCLYYSVPFRDAVINYPKRSPPAILNDALSKNLHYPDPNVPLEELLKSKTQPPTPGKPAPPVNQLNRPEDNKDSVEYKKKVALHTLPVLETADNSMSYGMKESLFTSLKDIFEAIVASPERMGVIRPYHFLEVLRREHEMFRTTMHQDAHEFLNLLLNEVVSNVEADASLLSDADQQSDGSEDTSELAGTESSVSTTLSSGAASPHNTRWVHELFEGTLTSETQCLTCETISQRDEVFLDLSVDLERHTSVTSCLRKFSQEEVLCERNKFHCDNCGGLQEAEKRMKLKRLPRVLALHLKRFKYSEDLDRLQKLFHRVVYPYHLRLFNTTDDADDSDRLYELYAVVVHIGGGPYHGHYVAIIKTEDKGWLLFDDEMVEPVDKNYVRGFFGDRPGLASAYVLFYQETTFEAMQEELAQETPIPAMDDAELVEPTSPTLHKPDGCLAPPQLNRALTATDTSSTTVHTVNGNTPLSPVAPASSAPPQLARKSDEASPKTFSNLLPHPKSPLSTLIPKIGDLHIKKERTKEEKERKATEKEKEKQIKLKQKESEAILKQTRKREEAQLKAAIEESKLTKASEDRRAVDTNKAEKENGLPKTSARARFKLVSRSVSHSKLFHREKDHSSESRVPDIPPVPLLVAFPPESIADVSTGAQPSNISTDDDKDDSTNATSVSVTTDRTALTPVSPEAASPISPPPPPGKHKHPLLKQASTKRSRFNLRSKSFTVF